MKLIADSGSTKTKWYLFADSKENETVCETTGINPFFQQSSDIVKTLESEFTLETSRISRIYFYGAGAANETKKKELYDALHAFFAIENIIIESDLLAAAHSLCGFEPGIAAIMGTGSNSCFYDGKNVVQHVSPLGFILGDEGSGAVLGKKLLADVLKNQFPQHLIKLFFDTYKTTPAEVLENVYRKPYPNRYLAAYTRFLSANMHEQAVHDLVLESFTAFFERNIRQYQNAGEYPVNFTGSIAWHFRDILEAAAEKTGFRVGKIVSDPLDGLIEYHRELKD